ncbi:MAG: hypothetical protein ACP5OA_03430 [Candidatus Woesearchaeota archaeon]
MNLSKKLREWWTDRLLRKLEKAEADLHYYEWNGFSHFDSVIIPLEKKIERLRKRLSEIRTRIIISVLFIFSTLLSQAQLFEVREAKMYYLESDQKEFMNTLGVQVSLNNYTLEVIQDKTAIIQKFKDLTHLTDEEVGPDSELKEFGFTFVEWYCDDRGRELGITPYSDTYPTLRWVALEIFPGEYLELYIAESESLTYKDLPYYKRKEFDKCVGDEPSDAVCDSCWNVITQLK